jgi:tRNA(Ile)-lysidine synthase
VCALLAKVGSQLRKQQLLKAGDRLGIAVSGGADSVALLRLMLELRSGLGIVLSVVHFNHKLRGAESDKDAVFVADLARRNSLELHSESAHVSEHAESRGLSLEAAARELRYAYFFRLLREGVLDRIATAHTLDDQAETVLLRLARGAGTRGLAGIYPELAEGSRLSALGARAEGAVIRPLLSTRRAELESYLKAISQDWREDASNQDPRFARNRVRHGILPVFEENLNPAIKETLAETAEIARAEEEYWTNEVAAVLPRLWSNPELRISALCGLSLALQRRVVRAAAAELQLHLEFTHVEEVLAVAAGEAHSVELPGSWRVEHSGTALIFVPITHDEPADYEYRLSIPGSVEVMELGTRVEAVLMHGAQEGYNPDNLLDAALLPAELQVRNWRAGDRFWPAHSKGPRKIKELLQDRQLRGRERKLWPVIADRGEIIWVRGFPLPQRLQARAAGAEAVAIREIQS